MIPQEVVQEVLGRADILQVVGDYVTLKKAGNSFKGLCPFHGEKTPSFHVTPSKGLYYCFGCGEGGSVVDFVMRMEGTSFPETVESLGRRFGVDVDRGRENSEQHRRRRRFKDELHGALKAAEEFFVAQLAKNSGAREYLEHRGITSEGVEAFKLGFAPDAWDSLLSHLTQLGVSEEIAEKAGLIVPRKSGSGYYDRFRNRLIFPVFDARGRVIAFGGRTLDPEATAKYINSPESAVYTKGKALYGLHVARETMRKESKAILVEGNIDVIQMYQAGFQNTVAPMGTALTEEQARLLKRYSDEVTCIFDGDKAGKRAAMRAIPPLHALELKSNVAHLPDGEDPDTFLQSFGSEGMQEILDAALPLAGWAVDETCDRIIAEPVEARGPILKELSELINSFSGSVVKRHYVAESARKVGVTPGEMMRMLGVVEDRRRSRGSGSNPSSPGATRRPVDRIERELLRVLLDSVERLKSFLESDGLKLIQDTRIAELLRMLGESSTDDEADLRTAIEGLAEESLKKMALEAIFSDNGVKPEFLDDWYRGAIGALTQRWIDREVVGLGQQLEAALEAGDLERMNRLNERFAQLQELRQRIREDRKINLAGREQDELH